MLREEVTAEDVSEIVSRWTGIPVQVRTDHAAHSRPHHIVRCGQHKYAVSTEWMQRVACETCSLDKRLDITHCVTSHDTFGSSKAHCHCGFGSFCVAGSHIEGPCHVVEIR